MGEMEGIGEAVTGGLLARALEPQAGEASADGHTHEKHCLNCGCQLAGAYCHCCGQKAHVHRSLRAFFQDLISALVNFEGKFWRTMPMLAWRPGELTRRYIDGQRARFISPVALYLFTVFAMFAVLNFTGALGSADFREGLRVEISENEGAIARLQEERRTATAAEIADIDRKIANRREDIAEARKVLSGEAFQASQRDSEIPAWLRPLVEQAARNPDLLMANIQDAASKYSWLLIPISVPFLWLLFPLRRRMLYDHTVFVTYSLSFMMMLVIAGGLLVAIGAPGIASLLFLVPPIHTYRQLKGAYALGRFGALVRTVALVTFAFIAASLFLLAAVALGTM